MTPTMWAEIFLAARRREVRRLVNIPADDYPRRHIAEGNIALLTSLAVACETLVPQHPSRKNGAGSTG